MPDSETTLQARPIRSATDPRRGLSSLQVQERQKAGKSNVDDTGKTKSIRQIVLSNVCTLFNLINVILAVAIILVGSFKNVTFMIIILSNVVIGIIQEIRSKKIMDRLTFLSASRVRVVRDGIEKEVPAQELVEDDLMILLPGNQVQADGIVVQGTCQVDESFITGEADAIVKEKGDSLMAGSYLVNGTCRAQATAVGREKYVSTISAGAKVAKKIHSEIMTSLQWIVRVVSVIIVPVGIMIFIKQLNLDGATLQSAVVSTTASLISMIPEGLMLLTSTALAVSVIRLSRHRVLVQQLYCIETLARVDTLCLDKTGTLTEGSMEVVDLVTLDGTAQEVLPRALTEMVLATPDQNATSAAILERFGSMTETAETASKAASAGADPSGDRKDEKKSWVCVQQVSFSSKTKWSGVSFEKEGTFCMGAAEFLLPSMSEALRRRIEEYALEYRVLLIVHSPKRFKKNDLPAAETLKPLGLVLLRDKIRATAAPTLEYFAQEGVDIKVISGDSMQTVAGIARYAGVKNWDKMVDATTLTTPEALEEAANTCTIFGRVTPQQKQELVRAMKKAGHTVAMTGDGVNDVLALKESDCSIAMASGTDAARNASELVLLDSNFDALPRIVAEGRRCINNVQRSSSLFLTKTVYAGILAVLFVFLDMSYPFIPIQMSMISATCIGIPAFFLALQPNHDRVEGHFLKNVIALAVPGGLAVAVNIGFILFCSGNFGMESSMVSTLCVIVAGLTGLITLYRISKPFNWIRIIIFLSMSVAFWGALFGLGWFLQLHPFDTTQVVFMLMFMSTAYGLVTFLYRILGETIPHVIRSIRDTILEIRQWLRNWRQSIRDRKERHCQKRLDARKARSDARNARIAEREAYRAKRRQEREMRKGL